DDGQVVAKSDGNSGWQFKTSPDTGPHTFGVEVSGSAGATTQRYSVTTRSLNVWYHVAGVYNAAARTLDIYVNGVLDNGTLLGTIPAAQVNTAVGGSPPVNTAPTISDITDRGINEDANTGAIAFTVGDAETAAGSLTVS